MIDPFFTRKMVLHEPTKSYSMEDGPKLNTSVFWKVWDSTKKIGVWLRNTSGPELALRSEVTLKSSSWGSKNSRLRWKVKACALKIKGFSKISRLYARLETKVPLFRWSTENSHLSWVRTIQVNPCILTSLQVWNERSLTLLSMSHCLIKTSPIAHQLSKKAPKASHKRCKNLISIKNFVNSKPKEKFFVAISSLAKLKSLSSVSPLIILANDLNAYAYSANATRWVSNSFVDLNRTFKSIVKESALRFELSTYPSVFSKILNSGLPLIFTNAILF